LVLDQKMQEPPPIPYNKPPAQKDPFDWIAELKVIKRIGDPSGFGLVYLVEGSQKQFAMKVLAKKEDGGSSIRFQQEINVMKRIAGNGIDHCSVPLVAQVVYQNAPAFLMPFYQYGSLDSYLKKQKLKVPDALKLIKILATSLDAVHQLGIVHNDLKPQNILIDDNRHPLFCDWGGACDTENPITRDYPAPYTEGFVAPEVLVNPAERAYPTADIFSLGVLLNWVCPKEPMLVPLITKMTCHFQARYEDCLALLSAVDKLEHPERQTVTQKHTHQSIKTTNPPDLTWLLLGLGVLGGLGAAIYLAPTGNSGKEKK